MTDDYPDTLPASEWAASAATEIGADDDRVEPGMQMLGWLPLAVPLAVAILAVVI